MSFIVCFFFPSPVASLRQMGAMQKYPLDVIKLLFGGDESQSVTQQFCRHFPGLQGVLQFNGLLRVLWSCCLITFVAMCEPLKRAKKGLSLLLGEMSSLVKAFELVCFGVELSAFIPLKNSPDRLISVKMAEQKSEFCFPDAPYFLLSNKLQKD